MLSAYRDTPIDWEKVVNTSASQFPRCMTLTNILDDEKA